MAKQIRLRRGTAAEWTAANPVLALGETGVETDSDRFKFGDGSTAWNTLGYARTDLPAGVPRVIGPYAINYNTAGLNNGVDLYTPAVGDVIIDVQIVVDTAWDGTSPSLDFGTAGSTTGIIKFWAGGSGFNLTRPDSESAISGFLHADNSANASSLIATAVYQRGSLIATDTNPLRVWVSQNGQQGGTAPGATQGSARIYVIVATPVAP